MNWPALWNEGAVIAGHALAAIAAIGIGTAQITLPKGTGLHRGLGYVWMTLMAGVALSSFLIHEFRHFGPFSVIHVLSVVTLLAIVYAIRTARDGRVAAHRATMVQLYGIALILTGLFTLVPGRVMHTVLFGG